MGSVTEAAEAAIDAKAAVKAQKGKGKGRGTVKEAKPSSSSEASISYEADNALNGAAEESGDNENDSDFEEDDRTMALIKGFEDDEEEEPDDVEDGAKGFEPGQELPSLPKSKQIPKKLKSIKSADDGPGVVYVG